MDLFKISYAFLFGNHDIEMGSKGNKNQISEIILGGKYSIFDKGHDHLNTLSLTYQGIMMTYGMSIDFLGYSEISKRYTKEVGL
jgi:hypothetical protein